MPEGELMESKNRRVRTIVAAHQTHLRRYSAKNSSRAPRRLFPDRRTAAKISVAWHRAKRAARGIHVAAATSMIHGEGLNPCLLHWLKWLPRSNEFLRRSLRRL